MSWLNRTLNVFRSRRLDAELDDELAFHIAERTDELIALGLPPDEAAFEARRRFGAFTRQREETRDMDIARSLEAFLEDVRYGARQLRLNPGFATVAVLSLALGIGANSGIFQLINALRLRPLAVPDPHELIAVDAEPDFFSSGWFEGRHRIFTWAQVEQMWPRQEALQGLLAFGTTRFNLSHGGEARYAEGLYVTPNFLDVLKLRPAVGSWLPADTDPRDCAQAGVLLGDSFWQREYGGDREVVGRSITLDGRPLAILGVTPASFPGLEPGRRFDVAVPLCADGLIRDGGGFGRLDDKEAWWLVPVGRVKPGWGLERVSAHFRDLSPGIFRETAPPSYRPDDQERYGKNTLRAKGAHAGVSSFRRSYENPLWILLASTALVLLIACANLANLLLARATAREKEMALRQAVGASRGRLIAQLLSESLVLAGLGAALGAWVAFALSRGLIAFLGRTERALVLPLAVDWRVVGFTGAVALATCLLFGLVPALRATRGAPADAMRGGRGSGGGGERHRLRRMLVVAQVAFSLVLLVGALLFGRSLQNLLRTDTGMEPEGVLIADVDATSPQLEPERRSELLRQLGERLAGLPDVVSSSAVRFTPFSGSGWNGSVHAADDSATGRGTETWFNLVGPGYFRTMKTPLLAGRDFGPQDTATSPPVAIVTDKLAQDLFEGESPVGRRFRYERGAGEEDRSFEIVGLVKDSRHRSVQEELRGIAFFPVSQEEGSPGQRAFALRTLGGFGGVMSGVKREMARLHGGLMVEFRVLEQEVEHSVARERLMAMLSGSFGVLAALLSALGLYGVMSYMVARRRGEIGVRLALGAGRGDISAMVLGEAGRLLVAGLVLGLGASLALSRYAQAYLFGLQANDVTTLALGCLLLALTAFAAAALPVRRAGRLDPAAVLRDE
jgi:predicted permease